MSYHSISSSLSNSTRTQSNVTTQCYLATRHHLLSSAIEASDDYDLFILASDSTKQLS